MIRAAIRCGQTRPEQLLGLLPYRAEFDLFGRWTECSGLPLPVTEATWASGRPIARSLPDARAIADELTTRRVRLSLDRVVYDPTDPVGRLLSNVLALVAEFAADLIRLRTREGMKIAKAKGRLRGDAVCPIPGRRTPARVTSL